MGLGFMSDARKIQRSLTHGLRPQWAHSQGLSADSFLSICFEGYCFEGYCGKGTALAKVAERQQVGESAVQGHVVLGLLMERQPEGIENKWL